MSCLMSIVIEICVLFDCYVHVFFIVAISFVDFYYTIVGKSASFLAKDSEIYCTAVIQLV